MGAAPLTFRPVPWSPRLTAAMARAFWPDGKEIAGEIVRGEAQAWAIEGEGVAGHIVTRLEVGQFGPVLVLVAGEGRGAGPVLDVMPEIARANAARTVRVHSRRPGMGRLLQSRGYRAFPGVNETVFFYGIEK